MYHGSRWHSSFPAPMVSLNNKTPLFINDFVLCHHSTFGLVTGKFLKCYVKVCNFELQCSLEIPFAIL